jgi:hypothetical protein
MQQTGGGSIVAEWPEEEDEGWGPCVNEGEEGGRPGGPAEGHWADVGERGGGSGPGRGGGREASGAGWAKGQVGR